MPLHILLRNPRYLAKDSLSEALSEALSIVKNHSVILPFEP